MTDLSDIARALFSPGKGILAADESVHTATERLSAYGISTSAEMRRKFRDLFLNAEGAEAYLSGAILFSETLLEKGDDGKKFPESLAERSILPGVKVDLGTEPMSESPQEMITKGLLDLHERLAPYRASGAVFTKWRAVMRIDGDHLPTAPAIHENARRLASYAKEVQKSGFVPIIEPEVLYEGKHSRKRAALVLKETLGAVFSVLEEHSADLGSLVLKTSMVLSGSENTKKDTPEEVAEDTLAVLMECVPKEVAGIAFLSGGQTPEEATKHLAAIANRAKEMNAPWPVTFSFARALQEEALSVWKGEEANVGAARKAFLSRLAKVSAALG